MFFKKDKQQVPKKLLIIEESVDLALLMKRNFMRKNYEVFTVHTMEAASYQLAGLSPFIVYLDPLLCRHNETAMDKKLRDFPDVKFILNHIETL